MKMFIASMMAVLLASLPVMAQCKNCARGRSSASAYGRSSMRSASSYSSSRMASSYSSVRTMRVRVEAPVPMMIVPPPAVRVEVEEQPRVIVRERFIHVPQPVVQERFIHVPQPVLAAPVLAAPVVFAPIAVNPGTSTHIRRGPFGRIREINTTGQVEFAGPRRAAVR